MIPLMINLLASGVVMFVASYLLPGVHVDSFGTALMASVVLALVNAFIQPLVTVVTLPINILTLGLFSFFIGGAMVVLVTMFVPGFRVDGIGWGIALSAVLAIINSLVFSFAE